MYELAMEIYGNAASRITYFKESLKEFVATFVPLMSYLTVPASNFVYKKGTYASEIYFIISGRVNYLYGVQNLVFKTMVQGSYFGEIEVLAKVPRRFSVMAE